MNALRSARAPFVVALLVAMVGMFSTAEVARAATYDVLLDTDNNPATGCSYNINGTPYSGIEEQWQATVDTNSPIPAGPPVPTLVRDVCGTPASGNVALGLAVGPGGLDVLELGAPLSGARGTIRLRFFVTDTTVTDSVLVTNAGDPIIIVAQSAVEIPTLAEWGLVLLVALLSMAGLALLRRRGRAGAALCILFVLASVGVAWAITVDGNIADWAAFSPLATDPVDVVNGDLQAVYGRAEGGLLYIRLDTAITFRPTLGAGPAEPAFTEGGGAVAVDPAIQVSNVRGNLTSGVVILTNRPDGVAESLAANTAGTSITASYNSATGELTLTGPDSPANFQQVLRSVTYNNTDLDPDTTARSITFQVFHGAIASNIVTKTLAMTAVSNAPVVTTTPGTTAFTEDGGAVVVDGGVTVTDTDSANLVSATVTITNPQDGAAEVLAATNCAGLTVTPGPNSLSITGNQPLATYQTCLQSVTYDNSSQNPGTTARVLSFVANDGGVSSAAATKTVTVAGLNDAPVVTTTGGSTAFTEDGGAVVVDSGLLVADADNLNLVSAEVTITNPQDGAAEVLAATSCAGLTVTPGLNTLSITSSQPVASYETCLRSVTYDNSSQDPDTTARVLSFVVNDGIVNSAVANKTVTVATVEDDPTAVDDAATVSEDSGATSIDVLANDTDPDGGAITISGVQNPSAQGGTVLITGGGTGVTYAPAADYCNDPPGTLDTFTYTLSPGGSVATVTVTVSCADDNPTAVNDSAVVAEDSGASTIDVQANDTDVDGGTISITAVTQPANGTVVITNGGADLTYAPNANYCNTPPGTTLDTFTYTLTPGGSVATVTVTVNCADDAPVAVPDAATVGEDSGANPINVLANDTDVDAGPISITSVTQPANGMVVITGGGTGLTYQPNANYCNNPPGTTPDAFTYTLTPGGSTATVSVSVTCINDGPGIDLDADDDKGTAGNDFAVTFTEGEAAKLIEDDVDATVTDVDSATLASLTVTITNLLDVGSETLSADVTGTSITANYVAATGVLTLTGPDTLANFQTVLRKVRYLNSDNAPDATPRVVQFVANDGATNGNTAVSTVTVVSVDTAPTAVNDADTVNEDSGATAVDVLANDTDPDGGSMTITSVTQPANGTVVITGGGTGLTYQPNANYCNSASGIPDTFTYILTPGGSTATVSMTVTCIDDNPTAVSDAATVAEDSGATAIGVLANDTDPDGGAISITSVTQPANGTVVITGGGTGLTYAPNANYCNNPPGTTLDTFTYTLTPGGSSATVTVTVTCVDDNPTAVADAATVVEDSGATAINVLANDTDVDGGAISVTSVTQPANGTVVITGGGTGLTYAPNANYCNNPPGTTLDTFTYTLTPGGSSTTVTVTVTCVDDPPTAVADAQTVLEDSGATSIPVLANDTDPDAGPISITSVTQPSNGTVVITGGGTGLTYAPNANYCNNPPGTTLDTFTYTLTPGGSFTTVTMTVTCVNDPPSIPTDPVSYSTPGNTQLHVEGKILAGVASVSDAQGVDAKAGPFTDVDGPAGPFIVDASGLTANGGSYDIDADGSFHYVPPVGFAGTDSFTYQVTDTVTPVNATVNITVGPRVWYIRDVVDANNAAGGDGRSNNAFDNIAAFNAATTFDNDIIFVFEGNTATTPHTGTITLKNGQKLHGEGIGLTITGHGTLIAAGNRPRIRTTAASTDVVSVPATAGTRSDVEIRGLDLEATGGSIGTGNASNAVDVTSSGGNAVGITISNNNIRGATGEAIDLNAGATGTFSSTVQNNTITSVGNGIDTRASSTGTTTVTASNNMITSTAGNAFDARTLVGASALRVALDNANVAAAGTGIVIDGSAAGTTTITSFGNNVVDGNSAGTGISVTSAIFDGTPGAPFNTIAAGTTVVGASGNGVGGPGMVLTSVQGDLSFTDLDIFADGGAGLRASSTTAYTGSAGLRMVVGAGVGIVEATGGPAVDITQASVTLPLSSIRSTNSPSTGLALNSVAGSFSAGSGSSISNITSAAGTGFQVGSSSATVSYAGTINTTQGKGVDLTSNSGSTISLTGLLTLSSGTNTTFNATGGGTVTATDTASTLTSTTGTALNVVNTTIGAGGLKFQRISAGTAASGPTNGIVLNNTGSSGGLTISGTGSAGSGGTIQRAATGISLTSTRDVSLAYMQLNDHTDFAIRGASVVNFSMSNMVINGTNGNDAGADEGSVRFTELTGSATISSSNISGAAEDNVAVVNTTGTLNRLTISNTTIGANSTTTGGDGLFVETQGSAIINATVQNSFFTSSRGDLTQFTQGSTGSMDVVIQSTAFSDNHPAIVSGGGGVVVGGTNGSMTFNINNNTFRDSTGTALAVSCGNAGQSCVGRIENNQVGLAGTANSGSTGGSGIAVVSSGGGTLTALVNNNQVRQYNNHGILLQAGQTLGNPTNFNVTVTGNTVSNPGALNTNFNGIHLNNGTVPGENFTSCVDIRSNSIAGAGTGAVAPNNADYRLRQRQSTTVRLPGYGGANNNDAAVVTFVSGGQTAVTTGAASNTVGSGGGGFVGGAACAQP